MSGNEKVCKRFRILNKIGEGGYGNVYSVEKSGDFGKDLHTIYALKTIKKEKLKKKPKDIEYAQTERYIMSNYVHPFIVNLKYAFQSPTDLYYVMEYVPGGEIFTRLSRVGTFTEQSVKFYTSEILLALDFLHSHNIVYRDLKPDNILIQVDGHIKLADFGLCKILHVQQSCCSSCSDTSPDDEEDEGHRCNGDNGIQVNGNGDHSASSSASVPCTTTRSCCGTLVYMAPEVVEKQMYGRSADFWSLGVVVYDMLVGVPPFHVEKRSRKRGDTRRKLTDKTATRYNIVHCNYKMPDGMTEDAKSFISDLLQPDVTRRLGGFSANAEEIKNHSFVMDINWKDVLNKTLNPPFVPVVKSPGDVSNFHNDYTSDRSEVGKIIDPDLFADYQEVDDDEAALHINNFDYTSPSVLD